MDINFEFNGVISGNYVIISVSADTNSNPSLSILEGRRTSWSIIFSVDRLFLSVFALINLKLLNK